MRNAEFLAAGETCKAMISLTPGVKDKTFDSASFSAEANLNFCEIFECKVESGNV